MNWLKSSILISSVFLLGIVSGYQFKVSSTLLEQEPYIVEHVLIDKDTLYIPIEKQVYKEYKERTTTYHTNNRVLTITYKGEILHIDDEFQYINIYDWYEIKDTSYYIGEGILDTLSDVPKHSLELLYDSKGN